MEKQPQHKPIICPYCGYRMPPRYMEHAVCRGVFLKCKNKKCGKLFEIRLPNK